MSDRFKHLLSPLRIGPKTVRNRVLVTAHVPRLAENGAPGEHYVAYHRARAKGGVGMQITGATPVHISSALGSLSALSNLDDTIIPGYRKLARAVHEEGGTMLAQLAHYGATVEGADIGRPAWAPSEVASEIVRQVPHQMTEAEIAEVVAAFGSAAARVKEGEMDGVEILGAFGLLIASFLSPYSNKRTDRYGGSTENRARFAIEVATAVREAVGPGLIVGMRIPGDECVEGGLDSTEMQEVAKLLEATGRLDYLNVAAGTNLDRIMRAAHWPPTPAPHGLFVPMAAAIKKVVKLPVFTVGRITDPVMAEQIVADGRADMVGMTRAHVADPEIVAKVRDGRPEDVRPCVGANVCIAHVQSGHPIRCIQNPETGREKAWGPAAATKKARQVLVVGGGPAGLEAARVAASRGHRVSLVERDTYLGGQFALRASIPAWKEFQDVIDWRRRELERLQVRIELGRAITADDLARAEVDAVVLATGALPRRETVPGAAGSGVRVATPHEILREGAGGARVAVVWDFAGGVVGSGVVEGLSAQGATVHVVTPAFMAHEDIDLIQRVPLYERLLSSGTEFHATADVVRVEGRDVVMRNVYSGRETRIGDVDLLVPWRGSSAVDELRMAIEKRGLQLHMIGDCLSPRTADVAIAEGALAGRSI
ncbi:MAG: FAD-dependent oxidoreductase [Hyphomicrobiaceae bacterium]